MNCTDFIALRMRNRERDLARKLRREQLRRQVTDTIDELCFGDSDIPVRRLPPVRNTIAQIQLRDAILAHSEMYDEDELKVALLFLRGYSPRVVFSTLGIPCATGYRKFGRVIEQLKEACHG